MNPENQRKQPPTDPGKKPPFSGYAKYSVMGFQMAAIIGLGVFGGIKLDEYLGLEKVPVFTLVLSLVGVVCAIYFSVKDLLKK